MVFPVHLSKVKSFATSQSGCTCKMTPGKKQVVNPIAPLQQNLICLVPLRLHFKVMPLVLKHILPSSPLTDVGQLLDSIFLVYCC